MLSRINDGHSVRAVPKKGRCVSMMVENLDVEVFSNRPSDITSSNILNSLSDDKRIQCLQLHTNMRQLIYSEDKDQSSGNDWKGLFKKLGKCKVHTIIFYPGEDEDTLLWELISHIRKSGLFGGMRCLVENRWAIYVFILNLSTIFL